MKLAGLLLLAALSLRAGTLDTGAPDKPTTSPAAIATCLLAGADVVTTAIGLHYGATETNPMYQGAARYPAMIGLNGGFCAGAVWASHSSNPVVRKWLPRTMMVVKGVTVANNAVAIGITLHSGSSKSAAVDPATVNEVAPLSRPLYGPAPAMRHPALAKTNCAEVAKEGGRNPFCGLPLTGGAQQ